MMKKKIIIISTRKHEKTMEKYYCKKNRSMCVKEGKKKICSRYHLSRRCIEYLITDQHHPQTWKLEGQKYRKDFLQTKMLSFYYAILLYYPI